MIPWPQTIMIVLSFGFLFAADVTVKNSNWDNFELFPPEVTTEIIYYDRIELVDGYYIPVQDSVLEISTKWEDRQIRKENKKIRKQYQEDLEY